MGDHCLASMKAIMSVKMVFSMKLYRAHFIAEHIYTGTVTFTPEVLKLLFTCMCVND